MASPPSSPPPASSGEKRGAPRMSKAERKRARKAGREAKAPPPPADDAGAAAPPAAEPAEKKKKKKKNKAMSRHAAYGDKPAPEGADAAAAAAAPPPPAPSAPSAPSSLEQYASLHSSPEPPLLSSLRSATAAAFPHAQHMLSGSLQGRLLRALAGLKGGGRALEIGTFTGYASLCLAEDRRVREVVTCEIDGEAAGVAREHFGRAEAGKKIRLEVGPAMDTLRKLEAEGGEPFDIVFIDADKRGYRGYVEALLSGSLLAPDALLLADNVLFKGLVLNSLPAAKAGRKKLSYWAARHQDIADDLHGFNEWVNEDPRVEATLVPLRDGITIIRRVS
ncbi:hypothetical protein TeGR_g390 [Tetraparma gracilis]|uniref:O-methyltransferase n=1 Tax=Tetraparma gracilis TaxID=2962635 RepID=A0ABQ6N006_9STRA|nr:hypothetical protein TeGR_g390 [Tetraparma gracilis]